MKRKSLLAILLAASMAASMTAATATVAFAETEEAAETAAQAAGTADVADKKVGISIYKFDDNFKIAGNYAENTKGEGYNTTGDFTVQGDESKAYSVELTYKGYDTKDPGSWDAFVAYRYLGAMVAIGPVYKGAWTDQKGIEFGVEFVPAENVLATLKYFDGKDISTDQDVSKFFGQLELQF